MTDEARPAVRVHIGSSDVPLGAPQKPVRRVVGVYRTIVVTADNPAGELVPESPNRHSWQITGAQAGATAAANDIVIGSNRGDIFQAAGKAAPLVIPGQFIPAGALAHMPVFYGTNAVFFGVLGAAPTYPMIISVTDHVYSE